VDAMLGATLCENVQPLDCRRDCLRLMEAPAGNLVADVMQAATGADVCMINGGTLRAERVIEAGPLTMRELFEILPMMETVAVIKVTGAKLIKALENSVSKYPKKDGRFAQVAGVTFVFDPDQPAGQRVMDVTVGGKPLKTAREYSLCSKEFICMDGKDGYDCFVGCPVLADGEAHPALPTFVQRHLAGLGKRGEKLQVEAEGRNFPDRPSERRQAYELVESLDRELHDTRGLLNDTLERVNTGGSGGGGRGGPSAQLAQMVHVLDVHLSAFQYLDHNSKKVEAALAQADHLLSQLRR